MYVNNPILMLLQKGEKIQNGQYNIDEEQSQRTDTTQLQDLV